MGLADFAAILLAASAAPDAPPAWFHVDSAADHANANFIDKASIHPIAGGLVEATMFTLLAQPDDGTGAYRFRIAFDCASGRSRLVAAESYDATRKGDGMTDITTDWRQNEKGTQGDTVLRFVCSNGQSQPKKQSLGAALPWDSGRPFL
jgi:hypothetical protein